MLNQKLLPSKFSIAVLNVPCIYTQDTYIDYILYNKQTKLYSVPVCLNTPIYKFVYKNDISKIIQHAQIVNYIDIDQYFFEQEQWNSYLYELFYEEWISYPSYDCNILSVHDFVPY